MEKARDGSPDDPSPPREPLPSGRWEVRLLGAFAARNGDLTIDRIASFAERLLLVRLALRPSRRQQRETLIEWLWPQVDPGTRKRRFATVLSNLRAMLEPAGVSRGSVLCARDGEVWLAHGSLTSDVAEFEASVRAGDKVRARRLYWGDLLPSDNHEWVRDERTRLRRLFDKIADRDDVPPVDPDFDDFDDVDDDTCDADVDPGMVPGASVAQEGQQLPSYLSSFVGREADIQRLLRATREHRLVSIVGAGGCGKTRLTIEAATRIRGFDIVRAVPLDRCVDARHVADHVRAALGLQGGASNVDEQVVCHLEGRRTLLLLDNLEQLADDAGLTVVIDLLRALPGLQVWITSRRVLSLADEHVLRLEPLTVPPAGASAAQVMGSASGMLFLDRARARRSNFRVGARNAAGVAELCRLLDGLPLAIELATARIHGMTPGEMATALRQRSLSLDRAGPQARRHERHASLAHTIDWSLNLLTPQQRQFLAAVTVLRGSWDEAQAAAVSGSTVASTRPILQTLVRDSLVRASAHATPVAAPRRPTRYHLFTSIREHVRELAPPDMLTLWRRRHRLLALDMAQTFERTRRVAHADDLENMVEAIVTSMTDGEPGCAVEIALNLRSHWLAVGTTPATLDALQRLATDAPPDTPRIARCIAMLATLSMQAGRGSLAHAMADRAVDLAGADPASMSEALCARVNVRWRATHDGAGVIDDAQHALALARQAASPVHEAYALLWLGPITLDHLGDAVRAREHFEAAARIYRSLGDASGDLSCIAGRLACDLAEKRFEQALPVAVDALKRAARLRHVDLQMQFFNRAGLMLEGLRRHDESSALYARQASIAHRHGMGYHFAFAIWNLCYALAETNRHADATQLMAFVDAYWQSRMGSLTADDRRYIAYVRKAARSAHGTAACRRWWALGRALTPVDALALAGTYADTPLTVEA